MSAYGMLIYTVLSTDIIIIIVIIIIMIVYYAKMAAHKVRYIKYILSVMNSDYGLRVAAE